MAPPMQSSMHTGVVPSPRRFRRARVVCLSLLVSLLVVLSLSLTVSPADATTVAFSRLLNTCDSQDQSVSSGTSKLVFSSSPQIPTSPSSIRQHTVHGTKSLRLTQPETPAIVMPSDVETLDLVASNLTVPFPTSSPSTSYYCHALELTVPSKRHVIGWEVKIAPVENIAYVHHVLIYVCDAKTFNRAYVGLKGMCDTELPNDLSDCLNKGIMAVWAVGGGKFWLPQDLGMPIGPGGDVNDPYPLYVLMQTHYNNPRHVQGIVDSSGIRVHHTAKFREKEAAVFYQGHVTNPAFKIPAQTASFDVTAYCPDIATKQILPTGGIHVSAVFLHMHLAGRAASLRHFRNHTELPPISVEPHYDFNYQDFNILGSEVTIMPGDELLTQCTYNTIGLDKPVEFGEATTNEMCLAFFLYYPRVKGGGQCISGDFTGLGNNNVGEASYIGADDNQPIYNYPHQVITTAYSPPVCTYASITELKNRGFGSNHSTSSMSTTDDYPIVTHPSVLPLAQFDGSKYARSTWLDDMDMDDNMDENSMKKFQLFWSVDAVRGVINFALQVNNSNGWVGFGLSPTGGMANSDMLIAYLGYSCATLPAGSNLLNGNPCITSGNFTGAVLGDRWATAEALPPMDSNQDFFNIIFYSDLPTNITGTIVNPPTDSTGTNKPNDATGNHLGNQAASAFWIFAAIMMATTANIITG